MLRLFLAAPVVLISFVWSLFVPVRARTRVASPLADPLPDPDAPSAESQEEGHEVTDANPKMVVLFVVGLFMTIFIAMGALGIMYKRMYADNPAIPVPPLQETFKYASQQKTTISRNWDTIDQLARQRLDDYGWTDRAHGVAHLPIARAMSLVASEGLPARTGQTPDFPPPDQEKLPLMQLETNTNATKFDPER